MNPKQNELRERARDLTHAPGVYLMKNKKKEIIYIGKAKNLKNRVSQYFQPNNPSHTEKVRRMVEQVDDFDYIVVDSEFEALVLECSLIKQNSPKYNILLKDDKGYHYIRITKGDYPRITAEKQLPGDDSELLGPYTSSYSVSQTVDEVNRIFQLPTCGRKFPQELRKGRPCLNFYIRQCMGVCRGRIGSAEYREIIGQAVAYIKKGGSGMVERLRGQMEAAAQALEFEKAARLRDRVQAIQKIAETQKVFLINTKNQDVAAFAQNAHNAAVSILKFRNYRLSDKEDYYFTDVDDLNTARMEFLNQYYLSNADVPPQILLDADFEGRELLQAYLSQKAGRKVRMSVPQKAEPKKMVEMAFQNASEKLSKRVERTGREVAALDELTKLLGLPRTPSYIEAYDISNLGESDKVGGMVVFENGRPLRCAYKKFKIKGVEGQDDYSSMREMLTRRLERYREAQVMRENGCVDAQGNPVDPQKLEQGFGRLPDLILLDGGRGHVGAIVPLLAERGLQIPVFGMVKDARHRTRAIAGDGGEIAISGCRSAFAFVTGVQDEVHRYAINFQKATHKKSAFEVTLTRVEGIGPKRAAALLKAFQSKSELQRATPEQLRKAAGIGEKTAGELAAFLRELSEPIRRHAGDAEAEKGSGET